MRLESGEPENTSSTILKWYRNNVEIVGATGITYTPVAADAGNTITFEVTRVGQSGTIETPAVSSGIIVPAPTATNVSITGTGEVGQTLIGSHTYNYS